LFDQGKAVAEVMEIAGVDCAFAYGVAKRAGKAETAARRRGTSSLKPRSAES
jgi:hypothetical protein